MTSTPTPRGLGSPRASTRDLPGIWPPAASISDTTLCGPTTSRPPPAWRRSRISPRPPRSLSSAWESFPSTGITGPDRGRHRPPRTRSRKALDRDRIRPTSPADRPAAARRRRAPRAPPAENRIVVAAMRPRLCRLGGAVADGVLLNWMLPDQRGRGAPLGAGRRRRGGARRADHRFIRPGRRGLRLAAATSRRGRPLPHHQRGPSQALRGHGCPARERRRGRLDATGVHERLAPYQSALDLPIVRVLANADAASLTAVADAAAP